MKSLLLCLGFISVTPSALATTLLSCNPPMGSRLQEIKITQEGNNQIFWVYQSTQFGTIVYGYCDQNN